MSIKGISTLDDYLSLKGRFKKSSKNKPIAALERIYQGSSLISRAS